MSREDAYAIVQRASMRAADERAPLHDLLAIDPAIAGTLSLAALDACFDDEAFLRHVPAVIERLDGLSTDLESRRAARASTARSDGVPHAAG
jgi:adenylosuccinate lyase